MRKFRLLYLTRVFSQCVFFGLFLFLFIKTDYTGSDTVEYAVNILFRIDPLLAFCTMLGIRGFVSLMIPSLFILLLSLIFGRAFCGWFCPMGSLLDSTRFFIKQGKTEKRTVFPRLSLTILVFLLVAAFFRLPLVGYLDPFSILVRTMVQDLYPALNQVSTSFFTFTYTSAPDYVNALTEPVYSGLQSTILPFEQKYFELTFLSFFILLGVVVAEFIHNRFFCRNFCPLGALLGFTARVGIMKIAGGDESCGSCTICRTICRMGAVDENRMIDSSQCSLCMECMEKCPRKIISPHVSLLFKTDHHFSPSRRQFVTAVSAGMILPPLANIRNIKRLPAPDLVRPPGSLIEKEFLQRCVRCGECLQVCITNGLQPVFLKAGVEGIFSPYLLARSGYCEYNCTLCGQVCPTGAIRALSLEEKHRTKIGHAWIDKNTCLPYAKSIPCIVCEEHCPTPEKAIGFHEITVDNKRGETVKLKQPYIIDELCIGCGICETKCPLPGKAAIYITNAGEDRDPDNMLPVQRDSSSYS